MHYANRSATRILRTIATLFVALSAHVAIAQDSLRLTTEAGLTFAHFQQQIKRAIGDPRGQRLVLQTEIGVHVAGTYQLLDWLAAGIYLRADFGERTAARFDGFDSSGRTVVDGKLGGSYEELWIGPLVRLSYSYLTLDLGYAALGVRSDDARTDIPSLTGDTVSSFTTHPTIAGLIGLGARVPLSSRLDLAIRAEYRFRYYHTRDGNELKDGIEHGTQSIVPLIAVAWRW